VAAHPPVWDLSWDPQRRRLRLTIAGHLDADQGGRAAQRFRDETQAHSVEFIADLSGMTGYDRAAREAWQAAFIDRRGQVFAIHFIGLTPVFRMAAATVCLATRIRAHFYESGDPLPPPEARR
jgi:hypothetical protein